MFFGYGVDYVLFIMGQKVGNVYCVFFVFYVNVFIIVYLGIEFKIIYLMVKGEVIDVYFIYGGDDGGEIVNYFFLVVN